MSNKNCPGCNKPFKSGEPLPDVSMCEICERYGKPKNEDVDPRIGSTCPHCKSVNTIGARSVQKDNKDKFVKFANAHCKDCDNGFSIDMEGKDMNTDEIFRKIDEGTVTCNDFNRLISESTPESIRDRLRRRTIKNTTDSHQDEDGHQQLQLPQFEKRIAPKRKPLHQQNHGRSNIAHAHSARTQKRTMSKSFDEEINFVKNNIGKPINECDLLNVNKHRLLSLAIRMMSLPNINRDWLYNLQLHLGVNNG